MERSQPSDAVQVARGTGISTFMGLRHTRDIDGVDAAIVGEPSDTGGTIGSRYAPRAMRDVSSLLRPVHTHHNIAPSEYLNIIDYGDTPVIPTSLQRTYDEMVKVLAPMHEAGVVPICLGGDHSVTLANLRAAARTHGPVAMLQFDSHTDTYDVYYGTERYTSGTMFRRAVEEEIIDAEHSMMVGLRGTVYSNHDYQDARDLGYQVRTMDELIELGIPQIISDIRETIGDRPLFITFDVDCLDPAYAPGTGTLEIGGLTSPEFLQTLSSLSEGDTIGGIDLVEVTPPRDPLGATAQLAAHGLIRFLGKRILE